LAEYELTPSFKRRLKRKAPEQQRAVMLTVAQIADGVTTPGLRLHPLQGVPGPVYSASIDRSNRVTFHRKGEKIVFRNHCSHDVVYRRP
jgi:hypothetical protein